MKRYILVSIIVIIIATLTIPPYVVKAQGATSLMLMVFCDYNANGVFDKKDVVAKDKILLLTALSGVEGVRFTPGVWVERVTNKSGVLLFAGLWQKLPGPVIVAQVPAQKAKRLLDGQMLFYIEQGTDYYEMPLQTCA